jgi:hypothetical protein
MHLFPRNAFSNQVGRLAALFLNPSSRIDKAAKILQPIIAERREGMKDGGGDHVC